MKKLLIPALFAMLPFSAVNAQVFDATGACDVQGTGSLVACAYEAYVDGRITGQVRVSVTAVEYAGMPECPQVGAANPERGRTNQGGDTRVLMEQFCPAGTIPMVSWIGITQQEENASYTSGNVLCLSTVTANAAQAPASSPNSGKILCAYESTAAHFGDDFILVYRAPDASCVSHLSSDNTSCPANSQAIRTSRNNFMCEAQ